MSFGERLKDIRQQLDWSQEHLAEVLNIGLRSLIRYENNQAEPSMSTLIKIARTLQVSADVLLELTPITTSEATPDISAKERYVLEQWRQGNKVEAIKMIVNDSYSSKHVD